MTNKNIRSIHFLVVGALFLSSLAPLQARPPRSRTARGAGNAIVAGVSYSANWVSRQLDAGTKRFPRWAKRRIVNTLSRFATPTDQERAAIEKWVNGDQLSTVEVQTWKKFRSKALSTRTAIAVIVIIILTILAAITYAVTRDKDGGAPIQIGAPTDPRSGLGLSGASIPADRPQVDVGEKVFFEEREWDITVINKDGSLNLIDRKTEAVRRNIDSRDVVPLGPLGVAPLPPVGAGAALDPATIARDEEAERRRLQAAVQAAIQETTGEPGTEDAVSRAFEVEDLRQRAERVLTPIGIRPVPVAAAAAEYGTPSAMGIFEEPPVELAKSYIDITPVIQRLERNRDMQEASRRTGQEYRDAMQAWGQRWQQMISQQPIDHQQEVLNVFLWLMEADVPVVRNKIIQAYSQLNQGDRAFLQTYLAADRQLAQKLQQIISAYTRVQAGQRQREQVSSAAFLAAQKPDSSIMRSLVNSALGWAGRSSASASAASAEQAPALITQWGRLKGAIERYLRLARRNIIAGRATEFAQMAQLQQFIAAFSGGSLNPAARQRIAIDLEGFIGSGKELQSLMTHIMRTGGGEEMTRESLRAVVNANFQAIPEVFKQAPINLSPETVYEFLNIPMNTPASNMRAIILAKIAALGREGYQPADLNWLQRQLLYYTDPYEKDRLDAYLGDDKALRRLQEQAAASLSQEAKGAQEDTVMQLIELLQRIQSQLQRS